MADRWEAIDPTKRQGYVQAGLDLLRRGVARGRLVARLIRQFGSEAAATLRAAARRSVAARDEENRQAQRAGIARYQEQRRIERERENRLVQLPEGYEAIYGTRRGRGYLSGSDVRVDVRYRMPGDEEDRRYAVFVPELTGLSSNAARSRIAYAIASHLAGGSNPTYEDISSVYDALLEGDWDVYQEQDQ